MNFQGLKTRVVEFVTTQYGNGRFVNLDELGVLLSAGGTSLEAIIRRATAHRDDLTETAQLLSTQAALERDEAYAEYNKAMETLQQKLDERMSVVTDKNARAEQASKEAGQIAQVLRNFDQN